MKIDKWSQTADMNEERTYAACTVIEGKIVVCGGSFNGNVLKSVGVYDYYENKWSYFLDMIERRWNHALVSTGNKMFVVGGFKKFTCEIFDSYSRIFSCMKTCSDFTNDMESFKAVCISNHVIVFGEVLGKHQ